MATTKKKISEQILRLIKGNATVSSRVQEADVKLLVEQIANKVLKADYFQVNLPEGDTVPNNCMVFSYDNIAVSTYKTTLSKASLPSIPINLPRNMGVLHVAPTSDINCPYVPIPPSIYGIIKPQTLLGDLSGLIGYEVVGRDIIFTKNLPALGITSVYLRLVGLDLSQLSDYDLLPLSSDQEAVVVGEIYKMLVTVPQADRIADSND
jgi:hypothetical protein